MAFGNIGGAEPSTITFKLGTITHGRGSTTEHQEIVVLGGADSSLAVAVVTDSTPASTAWGLAVREVAHSTGPFQVSSIAGKVLVDQNSTVWQAQVSSLAGLVTVQVIGPISSAAPAAGDSGVVVRQVGYSTTVQVSSVGGVVAVAPSSSGATGFYPVRLSDGSTFITDSTQRALRVTSVDAGGSTQVSVSTGNVAARIITDSGVSVMDSTNTAVRVNVVAGSAAGSTEVTVRQSSAADLNVTVAGYSTVMSVSTGSVRVHQSSAADLNVTVAGYSTVVSVSTGSVRVHQSTQADLRVTVYQSTASDLNVAVSGYSTIVSVSTGSVRVHQSTQADLRTTVYQSTATDLVTAARTYTSSGGAVEGSTASPAFGVLGLHVRQVLPNRASTSILVRIDNAGGSTTLLSSAAGLKWRCYAYSVMSTVVAISSCAFASSNKERWGLLLGTGSSGITGANLAINMPGSLFETDAAEALNFTASSTGLYRVSISYWQEP